MANPTTNYGFVLPTPTDLVTDLPADFDVALQGVDTRLKALQPGTTLGDIAYSSATANTNTRLGIGTTGQVLTVSGGVPAWATSSSGGMTLISTTTLSGASVTLSSIPQTYNDLFVVVRNYKPTNDDNNIQFRFNADSTANRHRIVGNGITQQNVNLDFNATLISTNCGQDNSVATGLTTITFPDYTNTVTWKKASFEVLTTSPTDTSNMRHYLGYGYYNQTSAITSLQFLSNDGDLTSGTVLLYGVK
jgi:hypothetical protein